jgi:nucleoside-diphosphate-sugar epimerase
MRVLITGHRGYIGAVLAPMLQAAGHRVVGLDTDLYRGCTLGPNSAVGRVPTILKDVRDIEPADLVGFEAIVHLAALSNDPLGNLDPSLTYEVNLHASIRLATLARLAGVRRFVFSSSCSVYGAAGDSVLDETAAFNPVTPYGESKVKVEWALRGLATDSFAPVYLRNATAYGGSPRLRLDLVVNEMVATALTEGTILVKSDGTPWRPLVHVEDIASAFVAALDAPVHSVANEAFNVGRTTENYTVSEIAELVSSIVPNCVVNYAPGGGPDKRSYRVDFTKAESRLVGFTPRWTLHRGIVELLDSFRANGLTQDDIASGRYVRLHRIQSLLGSGLLGSGLRWCEPAASLP